MERALFGLTAADVRRLAYELAEKMGLKHTFNSEQKMAGKDWLKEVLKLGEHVGPTCVWNMDEVGIQNVQKPNKIVGTKGKRQVGITAACAMNAAGQFVPPLFIFPRKRMNDRLMFGAPPGSVGGVTDSRWMDSALFLQWLKHFSSSVGCTPQRPHILILDGHHSHKTLEAVLFAREHGVVMITIPPHCSHKMQPLDNTFFKSLKANYNTAADRWMTCHPGQRVDIYHVCGLFNEAYSVAASVGKGQKGFKACGIWPVNRNIFKDEDFEGAEVTEEPDPAIEDSWEIGEELSTGPSTSSVVLSARPQPATSQQRPGQDAVPQATDTEQEAQKEGE
ncbi:hypothetical protein ACEWY4_014116 [Coilia grayii]|uniref:DDE-1 domain-containing protein n=1 Tax=Coilia grayii TaxID=363190 RepID=A0ABD1JRD0_9TELE